MKIQRRLAKTSFAQNEVARGGGACRTLSNWNGDPEKSHQDYVPLKRSRLRLEPTGFSLTRTKIQKWLAKISFARNEVVRGRRQLDFVQREKDPEKAR